MKAENWYECGTSISNPNTYVLEEMVSEDQGFPQRQNMSEASLALIS